MKPGPRPAPNHLKIIDGVEESRINRNEPTPQETQAANTLVPPVEMTVDGYDIWCRLVPDMHTQRVMTPWDVDQMVIFCETLAIYHDARRRMGTEYTARGSAGGVIKSPLWQIMRDAQSTITQIGARYGLSPSDRASLTVSKDDDAPAGAERLLS